MNTSFKKNFLFLLLFPLIAFSQNPPKREFRAAWIATVSNIDFPSSKTLTAAQQQNEFINLLNQHQQAGINAVVVQIRPTCDALYESQFEPFSEVLTGKQGQNPNYDPMKFMIEECRKRGMEFHAWFNPYRAVADVTTAKIDSSKHIAAKRPDLLLAFGNLRILNPGLQETRNYVTKIVMDVVRRYDIDGIHFDDYFYPYPVTGTVLNDDATFNQFKRGFANKNDWRRDNVDLFIKQVSDSIKMAKPYVKFGISPFGIWQNKSTAQPDGSATNGLQSYSDIYADSRKWIQQGWVDYLAPQLYWYIGFGVADYQILTNWWNNIASNRHIYIGQAAYRVNADANWNANEIPKQIRLNRTQSSVFGSIFYNTTNFNKNPLGMRDSLKNNYFKIPSLMPQMTWKDNTPPLAPSQLTTTISNNGISLKWNFTQNSTSEFDKIRQFVVYRFKNDEKIDISNAKAIRYITPTAIAEFIDTEAKDALTFTYVVTSLDRFHNESTPSNESKVVVVTSTEPQIAQNQLFQNYPNPFENKTKIAYHLGKPGKVQIFIHDLLGITSKILVDELQNEGFHEIEFDASDITSNVYIYSLITDNQQITRKMILIK